MSRDKHVLPKSAQHALDRHLLARYLEYLDLEGARLRADPEQSPEHAERLTVLSRIHTLMRAMGWAGPDLLRALREHLANSPPPPLASEFFGAPLALAILDPHTQPVLPWLRRADGECKAVVKQALAIAQELKVLYP